MLDYKNNLDRTAEGSISNWPFTYESTRDTGDGIVEAGGFLSVSINVDQSVALPCRFKGVTADGRIVICDAAGAEVCSGQLYAASDQSDYSSFFLYDQYAALRGFICCKTDVCIQLWMLSKYANDMHYFGNKAFVLLPQCHVQSMQGTVKTFGVNGRFTAANLIIRCSDAVDHRTWNVLPERVDVTENDTTHHKLSFSVYNIIDPGPNTWCRVYAADQIWNVEGCNLIIKAGLTSNLRVITTDASIILRGVLDA